MQLVNWQGALIGPGSEWFWSMLQFVIVTGTLVGLYRQLRIQSHQGAVEQISSFDRTWDTERFTRRKLDVFLALRTSLHRADLPFAAAMDIANFLEAIATLARSGHLDRRLLAWDSGDRIHLWWTILEPFARKHREDFQPRFLADLEWLHGVVLGLDRNTGTLVAVDDAYLGSLLERWIPYYQDELRIEHELRSAEIASPELTPVVTRAPARPAASASGG
jgi:hypothetical protein